MQRQIFHANIANPKPLETAKRTWMPFYFRDFQSANPHVVPKMLEVLKNLGEAIDSSTSGSEQNRSLVAIIQGK